jgi:putative sigma-54 modulation protein
MRRNYMSNVSEQAISASVTFRHTEPTDALKAYANDKITQRILKYVQNDFNVDIILSVEKLDHSVEVRVGGKGLDIDSKATTTDLYSAIDKVADTIDTLLRKQKDKTIKSHRQPTSVPLEA